VDFEYKGKTIRAVRGDITKIRADAIVNAANSGLRGGGGVDGAIHRAGGPSIMEECRKIGGCPTGSAVITGAGSLSAKHVIHAVGPIWYGGKNGESDLLRKAYETCLALADRHGLKSMAFPSISTGAYGYPIEEAAAIAIQTVLRHLDGKSKLEEIQFVLFSEPDYACYVEKLKAALS